ncbi:Ectonucleotide pyrophosphatase/phosphodiesterase family member 3 [Apodemus speciosus]|uniref:Ectonucleotide pyrophosphatase/phosphodiesterase family member 3 n=2 Tax=Murinae TaxID=39107 RepID=A0ABQ0F6T6_APOSI
MKQSLHNYGTMDSRLALATEEPVKKDSLKRYKILCVGSCRKKCFDSSPRGLEGCRCDSGCAGRGDCCWDFEDTCVKSTQIWTCNLFRCGESRLETALCSCADDCLQKKDCCADYKTVCQGETPWVTEDCASSQEPQCPEGVSLCSPGCPGTHSGDQAGLELRNPPASASQVLGLQACATTPGETIVLKSQDTAHSNSVGDGVCLWFDLPPVILFSMDGFRAEYLQTWSTLLPNINKLKTCGLHSQYMRAMYPTKTFPNHYTIVTGLYPESHGIIDNNMYDVHLNKNFSLSSVEKSNPAWWGGQPIWLTAMYQGLKAACYYWPGSDVAVNGSFPTIYRNYSNSVPYERRISTLLQWLDLPKAERIWDPVFIPYMWKNRILPAIHLDQSALEVIKGLQLVDNAFGMLMEGLKQRNLHNCVNIIVLADHGMDQISCDRVEYMTDYFPEINFYMYQGPAPRIRTRNIPQDFFTFNSEEIVRNLSCRKPDQHFKPYLTPDLPKRLHYAKNVRIEKAHLMVDRQWLAFRSNGSSGCAGGTHGYDNEFKSMEAIFLAHGPSFKEKAVVEPFENIEVYNLLCGSSAHSTSTKQRFSRQSESSPEGTVLQAITRRRIVNGCWLQFYYFSASRPTRMFVPPATAPCSRGASQPNAKSHQRTGRSNGENKFAIWEAQGGREEQRPLSPLPQGIHQWVRKSHEDAHVEFIHCSQAGGDTSSLPPTVPDCLRADVRVAPSESQKCSFYLGDKNITHGFLYPPAIKGTNESQYDALITSNLVPMYEEFKKMWDYFHEVLLIKYAVERNGLNVVSGPIFDYNYDGHFDAPDEITQYVAGTDVPIPTHYFVVLTSCKDKTHTPNSCPGWLDVLPFIMPHRPTNTESCPENKTDDLWIEERFRAHAARVRDVELLTGLDFYQEKAQPVSEILQLKTYLPTFETII